MLERVLTCGKPIFARTSARSGARQAVLSSPARVELRSVFEAYGLATAVRIHLTTENRERRSAHKSFLDDRLRQRKSCFSGHSLINFKAVLVTTSRQTLNSLVTIPFEQGMRVIIWRDWARQRLRKDKNVGGKNMLKSNKFPIFEQCTRRNIAQA